MTDLKTENNPPSLRQRYERVRNFIKPAIQRHIGKPSIREARKDTFAATDPLANRLEHTRSELAEETKRKEEAQQNSMFDELTGLHNRRWFNEEATRRMAEADRTENDLWLMYVDIDNFKNINDRYGHPVGDQILKLMEELQIRKEEPIVRLSGGGEEFVQLLDEGISEEDIAIVMARNMKGMEILSREIFQKLEAENKCSDGTPVEYITFSVGLAKYIKRKSKEEPGETIDNLVERADKGVYEAKHSGKNRGYKAIVKDDKIGGEIKFVPVPKVELKEEKEPLYV